MQSDRNSFYGNVTLDSVNMAFSHEDNIFLTKYMKNKHILIFRCWPRSFYCLSKKEFVATLKVSDVILKVICLASVIGGMAVHGFGLGASVVGGFSDAHKSAIR